VDASPRVAIDDMHRYRDAILYRLKKQELKQEVIGAFVLYPGRPAPHLCAGYDKSIAEENIGAIPLLPGHLDQLDRRLDEILERHKPAEHLGKAITTRGTTAVVGRGFGEDAFVLVQLGDKEKWETHVHSDGSIGGKKIELKTDVLQGRLPQDIHFIRFRKPYAKDVIIEVSFVTISGDKAEYTVQ